MTHRSGHAAGNARPHPPKAAPRTSTAEPTHCVVRGAALETGRPAALGSAVRRLPYISFPDRLAGALRSALLAAVCLLVLWAPPALAQTISATTYPFSASTGAALEDLSSGATQLLGANQDDAASSVATIGFDFWFVGTRYTQFSANSNGLVRLGNTGVTINFVNDLASTTDLPKIAPYWDDLRIGTNGQVRYKVVGSAPSRKLVIEWQNMQVPRLGSSGAGAGTFQCWLSEGSGQVEFVYGPGLPANNAYAGYSVGIGSSASTFASVTAATASAAYGSANNGNAVALVNGARYAFTPVAPTAATNLTFTNVTAVSMKLNWTDNATNEIGYAVYRSTDGLNYAFVTQLPPNTTSLTQSGLIPAVTYYWTVQPVSEGALGTALSGSQATSTSGAIVAAGNGNWTSTTPNAPWPGGVVPTASDAVVVPDGRTVTVNANAACLSLTIGGGTSGIVRFAASAAE